MQEEFGERKEIYPVVTPPPLPFSQGVTAEGSSTFDLTDFCTRCPQKDSCLPQDQTGIFCFVDERVTTTPRSKLVCVRVRRLNIFKMYKQTYYVTGGHFLSP